MILSAGLTQSFRAKGTGSLMVCSSNSLAETALGSQLTNLITRCAHIGSTRAEELAEVAVSTARGTAAGAGQSDRRVSSKPKKEKLYKSDSGPSIVRFPAICLDENHPSCRVNVLSRILKQI